MSGLAGQPTRTAHRFGIEHRLRQQQGIACAEDFILAYDAPADPARISPAPMAYCMVLKAERVMFTLLDDAATDAVLSAPFLYSAQLEHAKAVVSVPFERLSEIPGHDGPLHPAFVFSPGRAGSTLLTRLVAALSRQSASEPDVLTQICLLDENERRFLAPTMEAAVVRSCVATLAASLGPAPLIKLRSHCNARPEALLNALPASTALFLWRRRAAFGLSRHRTFGESAQHVAYVLGQAVIAYDRLCRNGISPRSVWYEDFARNPRPLLGELLPACDLQDPAASALLDAVLVADAQADTGISRNEVATHPVDEQFSSQFDDFWYELTQNLHPGPEAMIVLDQMEA